MKINPYQLRAARAMAGLSVTELAALAKVSPESVSDWENGRGTPREKTIATVWEVLDRRGIELIGTRGVALREDTSIIIDGDDAYLRLLGDVLKELRGRQDAEALFFFVDNSKSSKETVEANRLLRGSGIKCRYLTRENPERLDFPAKDYRAVPEEYFYNAVQIIYGDKVGQVYDEGQKRAIIIKSRDLAEAGRRMFALFWNSFKTPKKKR